MKLKHALLVLTVTIAPLAQAKVGAFDVSTIAALQSRADGQYDVLCTDGTLELVNAGDLNRGNVCPNVQAQQSNNVQSMMRRPDGSFDVICKDSSHVVATADQIMHNQACPMTPPPPPPPVVGFLTTGDYTPGTTNLCSMHVDANAPAQTLLVTYLGDCNNETASFTCSGNICTGVSDQQNIQITMTDSAHYKWQNLTYTDSYADFTLNANGASRMGPRQKRAPDAPAGAIRR